MQIKHPLEVVAAPISFSRKFRAAKRLTKIFTPPPLLKYSNNNPRGNYSAVGAAAPSVQLANQSSGRLASLGKCTVCMDGTALLFVRARASKWLYYSIKTVSNPHWFFVNSPRMQNMPICMPVRASISSLAVVYALLLDKLLD